MADLKGTSSTSTPTLVFPPSSRTFDERNSSPAACTQPPSMNDERHTVFTAVYIHTAKCDICEKRNTSVLQRCATCTAQFCIRCMEVGGGIHSLNAGMDWTDYGAQASSTLKRPKKTKYSDLDRSTVRQKSSTSTTLVSPTRLKAQHIQSKVVENVAGGNIGISTINLNPTRIRSGFKRRKVCFAAHSDSGKTSMFVSSDDNDDSENDQALLPNIQRQHHKEINIKDNDGDFAPDSKDLEFAAMRQKGLSPTGDIKFEVEMQKPHANDLDKLKSVFRTTPHSNTSLILAFRTTNLLGRRQSTAPVDEAGLGLYVEAMEATSRDVAEELAHIGKEMALLKEREKLAIAKQCEIKEAMDAAFTLTSMSCQKRIAPGIDEK